MNRNFRRLMNEATRLCRNGDLSAATATIQAALGRSTAAGSGAPGPERWVVDVDAREVPEPSEAALTLEVPESPDAQDAPQAPEAFDSLAAPSVFPWRAPAPGQGRRRSRADQPVDGRFMDGSHADAIGRRDYKLFVPPEVGERPLPLIVMLHGCTQNPDDFAAGTAMNDAARMHGFLVLYPEQSKQVNPQGCWNWFKHNHQQRGRGEPALLANMTREVMIRYAADPQRIYVAGLSAGGAMAAILGDVYPDLFAAVGVHSGLAAGVASDLPSALSAMKGGGTHFRQAPNGVPTIVFHGDADTTVHPNNAEQIIAASAGAAVSVEVHSLRGNGVRDSTRRVHRAADGRVLAEHWVVHGAPHAWSGGSATGSYTDGRGPDASGEMLRFFFEHPRRTAH